MVLLIWDGHVNFFGLFESKREEPFPWQILHTTAYIYKSIWEELMSSFTRRTFTA